MPPASGDDRVELEKLSPDERLLVALRRDGVFSVDQAESFACYVRLNKQYNWTRWGIGLGPLIIWAVVILSAKEQIEQAIGSLAIVVGTIAVIIVPAALNELVLRRPYEQFRGSLLSSDGLMPGVVALWEIHRSFIEGAGWQGNVAERTTTSYPTILAAQMDELLSPSSPNVRRVVGEMVVTILCKCLVKMPWDRRYTRISETLASQLPIGRIPDEAVSYYDLYRTIRRIPHKHHKVLCDWVDTLKR